MDESSVSSNKPKTTNKLNLSLDLRLICALLLVIIGVMLALWRPWVDQPASSARTITVTGESTIKAKPDEYVFSPQYEFKNADKAAALADLTAKQTDITTELKKLGVKDDQIKADSNGYNYGYYYDETARTNNYNLMLTITLSDKDLVQKVQDYLVTTQPTGSVSPQANFSDKLLSTLENGARIAALQVAKGKAEQSAKNLDFKLGKVKSVDDSGSKGNIMPMLMQGSNLSSTAEAKDSLAVQPGQNELNYSVTVVYYVK
jgi:uncharacterized protein YggE